MAVDDSAVVRWVVAEALERGRDIKAVDGLSRVQRAEGREQAWRGRIGKKIMQEHAVFGSVLM